ncbi:MAG TPA: XRE family transcriptional regulator [Ktedonobacteraceae bacterium]|jgi:Zn-dependent peptidase ImmA (M78 family)/transcriptional regulator with XRE-family HTH domain|nr:XRE family transcriptional regulator [Ktedonobacteraceae bacterium]
MINGYRIRQARELMRLTQSELAESLEITQSTIAQIESGRLMPSDALLEAIASRLGFPLPFFGREDPPNFPLGSLLFRSHVNMAAADRDEVHRLGQLEFEVLTALLKRVRNKVVMRLPQLSDEQVDIVAAAQYTRNALGLSFDVPIPHLVKAVEQSGASVLALPAHFATCDAFSLWANVPSPQTAFEMKKPLIVLSGETPGDRLRSTLAHELGHLVMHQAVRGTAREMEDEAYRFAAELLLPEQAIREEITTPVTLTSLSRLKPVWGVSIQMLIRRAYDLKIITERQYRYLFKQLTEHGWRTREPISLQVEKPRALQQMAEIVYGKGTPNINYQQFARDVDLYPLFVKRLLSTYATREEYSRNTVKKREEVDIMFQALTEESVDDEFG